MLTEVEKRHFHVPEEAKVGANVVGMECCANFKLWSKFKIPCEIGRLTGDLV
jgi:hypothetical protein